MSLVGFTLDWLDFFVGISISDPDSCLYVARTSIIELGTQDVQAYLMAFLLQL